MSALGEYYRGMGAAAMDQARAAHETAAAHQTGADAAMIGAQGQVNLHNAQASMVRPLGESEIGLQSAQGNYYGAQSNLANENAKMVRPLGESTIGYQGAMGSAATTNAATGAATGGAQVRQLDQGSSQFAKGTSNIKAPGDGTVDTTKARLANGEAVLNKGAAEHLGQPAIQALNAIGMLRMGMVPGSKTQDDRVKPSEAAQTAGKTGAQGYAEGTSKAGPKGGGKSPAKADSKSDSKSTGKSAGSKAGPAPSDTPSLDQIDPRMLSAALHMGLMGQGGGQPGEPGEPPQAAHQTTMPPAGGPGMGMM